MTRKLDALFAERVLGCNVEWVEVWPRCECGHREHSNDADSNMDGDLWHYTESLDAAWQGVERTNAETLTLDRMADEWDCELYGPCTYERGEPMSEWATSGRAPTPALAIVLACLRAVGVAEQEIEEARK